MSSAAVVVRKTSLLAPPSVLQALSVLYARSVLDCLH